jgi:phage terminase large subunit-like protein
VSDDGGSLKLRWLREAYFDKEFEPSQASNMTKMIFVDPANSRKKGSDYTVMWVLGLNADRNVYVLDVVRDRLGLRERGDALFSLHKKWRPIAKTYYEEYGAQADISYMRERMTGQVGGHPPYWFHIQPIGGIVKKEDRILRLEPMLRDGRIKMPKQMMRVCENLEIDMTKELENEYRAFPVGAKDDMLDSLARVADPAVNLDWPVTQEERMESDRHVRRKGRGGSTWMSA